MQPPSQRPPGRPKRDSDTLKGNTSQHILRHAAILFAQRGYTGVSVNDIVVAAEVSKPTLYYYFPDKEALFAAVMTDIIDQAGSCFERIMEDADPLRDRLINLAERYFNEGPDALPYMLRDVAQHLEEPYNRKVTELYRSRIYAPLEAIFNDGIRSGELRAFENVRLLTELFLTMLDWLALRFSLHDGPPLKPGDKAGEVVDLFLTGIRR